MKNILALLVTLLTVFASVNAQDIKRNAFEKQESAKISDSVAVRKRINPNFPVSSEDSTKPVPQTSPYVRPDAKTRTRRYLNSAFGLPALLGAGVSATIGQIRNNPVEWEKTGKGFAKRFGSSYAQGVISRTTTFGINEAFKLDNHFEKSGQKGFGKRFKHALAGSFTTRTKTGKRIPDFPQFIGTYTGQIISRETWFPKRFTYKDGLRNGTVSIFTRFGINLVREFISR